MVFRLGLLIAQIYKIEKTFANQLTYN
ncbi:hypothetical protein CCYN49044_60129 [Capnocytophaga cynodegmi]|uniref:Uncharacterized protein n=1 Tax=Capnocytophaga cynodegmi TaxID=28189 RepID=A0A0B7H7Z3_9FLAO|nr:hypothetical protein CCYN74_10118 [Capnocytophaga cynodegmi]CEN42004.1 hypothetical protein CCYN49044_60129 [Capnocytophaga cynodegmi]